MKRIIAIIVQIVSVNVGFAQNWSSEAEINNYYNDQINQKKAEISNLERQKENEMSRFYYDENRIFHGDRDAQTKVFGLSAEITALKSAIERLESVRSSNINSFRQVQKAKQDAARKQQQQKAQQKAQQRAQQKQQKQEQQKLRQRQIEEERAKKAEEDRKREEQRQERIRIERERMYNEAYNESMRSTEGRHQRNLRKLEVMDERMAEIRSQHQLDGITRRSGYVKSSGETPIVSQRSKAGILPNNLRQRTTQGSNWLEEFDY